MKFSWSLIKNLRSSRGNYAQNPDRQSWRFALNKLVFNLSTYKKYGLYTHDVICERDFVVRKALRRLPKDVLDARNFRIIRAMQLDFLKINLPREKWVTHEQDIEYRYLHPYMKEIQCERAEIKRFGCHNYKESRLPG